MYADKTTDSNAANYWMKQTERRVKQLAYNEKYNITPTQITSTARAILGQTTLTDSKARLHKAYIEKEGVDLAADPVIKYMDKKQLQKANNDTRKSMEKAVKGA